ncbi:hypothetical protein LARI1_G008250 [Lachnellula arida]|uniref:FluG domain-containing protein n=1 Tax=Lachnellula arida TaxID=1316785 RepID=A0A8T9B4W6_9HELO|nr:hypothetical protein LARI1_G008250 [Lachnellula arida]
MATVRHAPIDLRLPNTSALDLQHFQNRVERRRPKPKNKRPPEYYRNLIERHDKAKTAIKHKYSDATKDNLSGIKSKFMRFCDNQLRKNWRSIIRDCSKGTTLAFFRYIYDEDRVNKRGAMQQYIAQFKMLFNRENGHHMDTNDAKEVLKYIDTFGLDNTVKSKPVLGVDDLLLLLNYHWARDTSTFSTERHRVQFALILLLLFGTGCRPAELVDAKKKRKDTEFDDDDLDDDDLEVIDDDDTLVDKSNNGLGAKDNKESGSREDDAFEGDITMSGLHENIRQFDAICYEDVRLLVVRSSGSRERANLLAMEVTMAHHKGHKRRPKPTIFFFTEVDDPIFCPITHLVSLALADGAFEAPSLTTPERVFEHKVWGPVLCTPLRWKQEMLQMPIFRRDERMADKGIPSPETALPYSQFRDCLNRLGRAAGFKEILTSYCFRRGTANVVDRTATDAVRDQVMRHNPNSAVFNGSYINERVRFDVQSAVLERPSADGVLRMLTHMSLMRDPRAPVHVPDDVLAALPLDPDITAFEQQREQLKAGTYRVQGTGVEAEVRRLTVAISSARSKRRNIISEEYRADYFRRRPTEDIERQNNGQEEEEYTESVIEHQIPQRSLLVDLICTRVTDITLQDAVQRRIQTANLMLTLCGCREVPRRYRLRVALPIQSLVKEESPDTDPFSCALPLVCSKAQCVFCLGDESKSYEDRIGSFCRPAKMMDHVERVHLKGKDPDARIECCHPICKSQGLILEHLQHFKSHVQTVHGITLREPRFVRLTR